MKSAATRPIRSIISHGSGGLVVEAECHVSNGLPAIVIVGLAAKAIDEAKERIRGALSSSRIPLPRKRITINLAPADIHKDSTGLDLAIALAILQYSAQLKHMIGPDQAVIGELGLDGSLRPVRGLIGKLLTGKRAGITSFIIPESNLQQAELIPDITLLPASTIRDIYLICNGQAEPRLRQTGRGLLPSIPRGADAVTFADIAGQATAKRALTIAAAGRHNILLSGPPGTGKSLLARALPSLLPPLTVTQILEVTHLHSLRNAEYGGLVTVPPFRAPHHTASRIALLGGGAALQPGEISLSHHGVLLLDELPEFGRNTIEALRQPLEDRAITLSRAHEATTYPADFLLVATTNPCPCGYYGSPKECRCPPYRILQYQQRLSGPILDRIDLFVTVDGVQHDQLLKTTNDTAGHTRARELVLRARKTQTERFGSTEHSNGAMTNRELRQIVTLSAPATALLRQAAERLNLSARSYMRVVKVAQTIADIAGSRQIGDEHLAEALSYRPHGPI